MVMCGAFFTNRGKGDSSNSSSGPTGKDTPHEELAGVELTDNATADGETADSWLDHTEADAEEMCFQDTSRLVAEPARASLDILDVDEISMDINALPDVHHLDEISTDNAPPPEQECSQDPPPARNTSGQFEYSKAKPEFAKAHTKHALPFEEGSDDSD